MKSPVHWLTYHFPMVFLWFHSVFTMKNATSTSISATRCDRVSLFRPSRSGDKGLYWRSKRQKGKQVTAELRAAETISTELIWEMMVSIVGLIGIPRFYRNDGFIDGFIMEFVFFFYNGNLIGIPRDSVEYPQANVQMWKTHGKICSFQTICTWWQKAHLWG